MFDDFNDLAQSVQQLTQSVDALKRSQAASVAPMQGVKDALLKQVAAAAGHKMVPSMQAGGPLGQASILTNPAASAQASMQAGGPLSQTSILTNPAATAQASMQASPVQDAARKLRQQSTGKLPSERQAPWSDVKSLPYDTLTEKEQGLGQRHPTSKKPYTPDLTLESPSGSPGFANQLQANAKMPASPFGGPDFSGQSQVNAKMPVDKTGKASTPFKPVATPAGKGPLSALGKLGKLGKVAGPFAAIATVAVGATAALDVFGKSVIESSRGIAKYSGVMFSAFTKMDYKQRLLDVKTARETSGTASMAIGGRMARNSAWQELASIGRNMMNILGAGVNYLLAGIYKTTTLLLKILVLPDLITEIAKWFMDTKEKDGLPLAQFLQKLLPSDTPYNRPPPPPPPPPPMSLSSPELGTWGQALRGLIINVPLFGGM